jgi:hypothetical protein
MLFNWFKKKDKMVPLEPVDSGQPAGEKAKPDTVIHGKPTHKPFGRPVMAETKKTAPVAPRQTPPVDANNTKTKTSDSVVIRIGKLGEVLLQYSMISRENLEKALAIQQQSFIPSGPQDKAVQKRKLLGEILIENNFVTEEQLLSAFARHCRIPYIKLNKYGLPKEAIKSVPEDLILKHKVMPVDKIGSMLMLAVTDPYDTNAVEEVAAKTGLKVKSILCKQSEFAEMVKFYYPHIDEKPVETPVGMASEATPKDAAPDVPAKPAPAQETERLGEETAVFKIEELPFPEPPPTAQEPAETKQPQTTVEKIEETPASQSVPATEVIEKSPIAPAPSAPQATEAVTESEVTPAIRRDRRDSEPVSNTQSDETTSMPEDKKESFLGGSIEDHSSDLPTRQAGRDSEPAPAKPEAKTEPVPEVSPQPLQAQESGSPAQQPPETSEVNGYDTSLIDIQDLVTAQKITSDENIEIISEEPDSFAPQDEPIDVIPYIYPAANAPTCLPAGTAELPSVEVPINRSSVEKAKEPKKIPEPSSKIPPETGRPAEHKPQPALRCSEAERPVSPQGIGTPVSTPSPEAGKESFKENPVLVSDDEFLVARQLFATQLSSSWEKLYHRSKPSHAEKVDENEFVFHTESAIR